MEHPLNWSFPVPGLPIVPSPSFSVKTEQGNIQLYSHSWLGLGMNEAFRLSNKETGEYCSHSEDSNNSSEYSQRNCQQKISETFKNSNLILAPLPI